MVKCFQKRCVLSCFLKDGLSTSGGDRQIISSERKREGEGSGKGFSQRCTIFSAIKDPFSEQFLKEPFLCLKNILII